MHIPEKDVLPWLEYTVLFCYDKVTEIKKRDSKMLNEFIDEMYIGDEVEGFYILSSAELRKTSSGKSFLSGTVSDRTGSMDFTMWDYKDAIYADDQGKVIYLRGTVNEYRGAMQLTVSSFRFAEDYDKYDVADLVPTAPIDAEACLEDIKAMIKSIEDENFRELAETMLRRHMEEFSKIPAAKRVHHGFLGGLLMHTYNMLRTADFLSDIYADAVNRSLLLTGTLLHDFGKMKEFEFSELGMVSGYSVKGDLLGHLVMGASEVEKVAKKIGMPEEKAVLVEHMLLSHHGEPDHGAAVIPQFAEAELLHFIDMIDSRMEIYAETLPDVPAGEFSSEIFSLGKRIYNHGL